MRRGGTVLYFNTAAWDHVVTPFAGLLKSRHDIDTVMLTSKELLSERVHFFDRRVFREIIDWRPDLRFRPPAEIPDHKDLIDRADQIERIHGFSIVDVIRADRHVGAGFVTGATGFVSRYAQGATFEQLMDLAIRICERASNLLDRYRPLAIIGMAGTIHTTILVNLAEKRGIPVRFLGAPRRENLFFWCANRYAWPTNFETNYRNAVSAASTSERNLDQDPKRHETPTRAAQVIRQKSSPPGVVTLLGIYYRILRSNWRQILGLASGDDYGAYSISNKLIVAFYRWRARRAAARQQHMLGSIPSGIPTVFFPLSMEPESSLMVESQGCDTQLTPIDWLAKTMPAGWRLLVKEHPAMELPRPEGFWERIRGYPNVVVLAMTESADAAVRRSTAVAMINSTVGLQAAALGKPVICFNRNFIGSVLPHVIQAFSYDSTRAALRRIRDDDLPSMPERQNAMVAYRAAYAKAEFPIGEPALLSGIPGTSNPALALIETIVDTFLASIDGSEHVATV